MAISSSLRSWLPHPLTVNPAQAGEYHTYASEPERGRRTREGKEQEKRAVNANRRRTLQRRYVTQIAYAA